MRLHQPLTFAYANLVFGRDADDAWSLYRVHTDAYAGFSRARKVELLATLAACAYALEADFQILRVSRDIVAGLGLSSGFFQIYGGNSFETKKPDPLGANTLMKEAGVAPEETVMVGDSQVDILTARNAGMWSIGVTYGFAPSSLEVVPPDVLVDTPAELAMALSGE